jgi:hypothetical protein
MRRFLLSFAVVLYVLNFQITPTAQESGKRIKLFDGISLKGWTGNPAFWFVKDGAIRGVSSMPHRNDAKTQRTSAK